MKAVVLQRNGSAHQAFELVEVAQPNLKNDQVLIKVEAFGINYADVMARQGLYKDAPPLPSILGYEVVGEIVTSNASKLNVGERVLAFTHFGGYAEYAVAEELACVKLSKEIPTSEALALATQYCTAIHAFENMASVRTGESVLIHAASGGVGNALVDLARNKNCYIVGTSGSEEKVQLLNRRGVNLSINYSKNDFENTIGASNISGIDAIFDPIGGRTFRKNKKLLAQGGRLIMFGVSSFSGKKGNLIDKLSLAYSFGLMHPLEFLLRGISIQGLNMLHLSLDKPELLNELMMRAVALYKDGIAKPQIGWKGTVEQLAEVHDLMERRLTTGKLVVYWK
ncbi:MAG TPA: alcohol dehydrogenase [Flavobacteriales bacterium]|jgi:NADPH:quinone reductase-like Zn-dependent oxidoreductase|nr:alcohol dehydrogenase [Flavobacteriales bacterium]